MKEAINLTSERPDIQGIMADIRARVRAEVASSSGSSPVRRSLPTHLADMNASSSSGQGQHGQGGRRAGELLASEELRYLNSHYGFSSRLDPASLETHRSGFIGRCIVRVKRKVLRVLRDSLLRDYLQSERDFQAHLVRFLNDVSKYVDARDASCFWELVRKIDYDSGQALERIERIADEQQASIDAIEKRFLLELKESLKEMGLLIGALSSRVSGYDSRINVLEGVVNGDPPQGEHGYRPVQPRSEKSLPSTASAGVLVEHPWYLSLENVAGRFQDILDIVAAAASAAAGPILELGSGRGDFLSLMAKRGLAAYGVERDEALAQIARSKDLKVESADALSHLKSLGEGSLGAVVGIRFVEYLTYSEMRELFELCSKKVAPGGLVLFEALNPQSFSALTSEFFRDPRRHWPVHPDTLSSAMRLSGLTITETRWLTDFAVHPHLQELEVASDLIPRWADIVQSFNQNVRLLNHVFFGPQSYCVVAEKRA